MNEVKKVIVGEYVNFRNAINNYILANHDPDPDLTNCDERYDIASQTFTNSAFNQGCSSPYNSDFEDFIADLDTQFDAAIDLGF